jgi:hypothetical protein
VRPAERYVPVSLSGDDEPEYERAPLRSGRAGFVIVFRDGRRRSDTEYAVVPDPPAALELMRRAQAPGLCEEVHAAFPSDLVVPLEKLDCT